MIFFFFFLPLGSVGLTCMQARCLYRFPEFSFLALLQGNVCMEKKVANRPSIVAISKYGYLSDGFAGGSAAKQSVCNAGDLGSIPGWEDLLEKGTVTHSSILAWRMPWTEEPGRLQSMRLQRVRHN